MNIRRWIDYKITSILTGIPTSIANNGKPIDVVTIRYKDLYFFVDIDVESEEPTGSFGWSEDPTMNPTVAIREFWTAEPPKTKEHTEVE